MNKKLADYLESELYAYPYIDKRITQVREEIMYPHKEIDENIGGNQTHDNVSQTEIKATRLTMDKRLGKLEEMKAAINKVYSHSNVLDRRLMEHYYFTKPRKLTMQGVAQKICVSPATAYRMRKHIIKRLADELGLV